ncbi:S8 family serine peptidase [Candidatus Aalborgicola defluviihabitans]|jgi:serine protease|uniref:S8 family serine peptidase n=1 Tax=Candidatus Aalborgicola defluviihabitans TaxID=3386187 RepID=UPI001D2539A6|nr:S8 family serine peptidase [Burkholderiales bacterium]MBK7313960.1 S8 family serine peptidase [Burkholderiales bacterium]
MTKVRFLLTLACALATVTAPLTVLAQDAQRYSRIIIKFRDDGAGKGRTQSVADAESRVRALNRGTLSYLKSVSPLTHVARTAQPLRHAELQVLAQAIATDPRVEYAEVDERIYPHFTPNDPLYASQQWNLKSPVTDIGGINLPNAWGRSVGGVQVNGRGVTVAVLDTGYRPHADLVANILPGYDFISADGYNDYTTANDGDGRDADALDPGDGNSQASLCDVGPSSWHGLHVAGIIAATGNNNVGISGIAFGARILPLRVLGVCGGYSSDSAAAIQWAVGLPVPGVPANPYPAKVINMSFGRDGACSATYQSAITAARNTGAVVVISTGNDSSRTTITQPANCAGVIAVTAHTASGANTDYANVGPGTTISAPGNTIMSTGNTGSAAPQSDSYDAHSGTSFSAPQVAGVVALLAQIKPGISPAEVQTHLVNSARPHPSGTYCAGRTDCGAGLLDAFRAVTSLLQAQGISNAAPVFNALPTQYVLPNGNLQFTTMAMDAEGDAVSYSASGLPTGASFNAATGVFTWNKAQPLGDYNVVIEPTDGATAGASVTVKISVTNTIPVVVPPITPPPPPPVATGGGGGGAMGGLDAVAGLLLLLAGALARRPRPAYRVQGQDSQ